MSSTRMWAGTCFFAHTPEARAYKRAEQLLKSMLTKPQRDELRRFGRFTIVGPSGTRYRIHRSDVRNIYVLDQKGNRNHRLCWYMIGRKIPQADQMLAQKIMIEADEEEFLRVAEVWPA